MRYRERLNAPLWLWLVSAGLTVLISVAIGAALGSLAGLLTLVIFAGLIIWGLLASAPLLTVNDTEFRVGRAHIEWEYVGLVATLDAESTKAARGVDADPRAFAVMRPLTAGGSVTIEVLDDADPHPYWLVTTRNPQELAEAITAARHAAHAAADQ